MKIDIIRILNSGSKHIEGISLEELKSKLLKGEYQTTVDTSGFCDRRAFIVTDSNNKEVYFSCVKDYFNPIKSYYKLNSKTGCNHVLRAFGMDEYINNYYGVNTRDIPNCSQCMLCCLDRSLSLNEQCSKNKKRRK